MDEALKDYLNKVGPMQLGLDIAANKNYSMASSIEISAEYNSGQFRLCVWRLEGGVCNYHLGYIVTHLCVGTMIVIPLTACETVPFLNTDTAVFMFVPHGNKEVMTFVVMFVSLDILVQTSANIVSLFCVVLGLVFFFI
jgi:hypothetical protein